MRQVAGAKAGEGEGCAQGDINKGDIKSQGDKCIARIPSIACCHMKGAWLGASIGGLVSFIAL